MCLLVRSELALHRLLSHAGHAHACEAARRVGAAADGELDRSGLGLVWNCDAAEAMSFCRLFRKPAEGFQPSHVWNRQESRGGGAVQKRGLASAGATTCRVSIFNVSVCLPLSPQVDCGGQNWSPAKRF